MSDRFFLRLLFAVLAVCLLATLAHLLYTFWAYQHCSIIYFIAKELW
ncbi:MAG: hypothetical protein IJ480_11410 [Clostridia bacterium]|nr:hypothetical protein [Clostridia bacterium]